MIYGQKTTNEFTILAACDSSYLYKYAKSFITSCGVVKNNVHIHLVSSDQQDIDYLEFLKKGYTILNPTGYFTYSYDNTINGKKLNDLKEPELTERKVYYQCSRFRIIEEIVNCDILILDIDSLILKNIEVLDADVGLFFRHNFKSKHKDPWLTEAGQIPAGIVYCSKNHLDFFSIVNQTIESDRKLSGLEQMGLLRAFQHFKDKRYKEISLDFFDWKMTEGTPIWTAKGNKGKTTPRFLSKQKEILRSFPLGEK